MTYKQAMRTPKCGWAHANDEHMLAFLCERLGAGCCLNPEQVFKWATKHSSYNELRSIAHELIANAAHMELLVAVLNDEPLERNAK
jgi:hypothetical protein